ncbi:MAG: hypothetical protein F4X59_00535 [Holophagales bacterium]|nr:hypothetical protein [Holophagales bacterium]MXX60518.1 hypothetical protein [Holophagales bacterium]MYC08593.1 hypothetical protein [Holophagales bacterium]MYD23553.1 hypothetical protein [Holophagales bacterium]MYI31379.1 hypothetical protein [Holophagales bacterium]
MRLHRFLVLAALPLLALAVVACSPQAEATDADLAGEAPPEDASFPLSAKGAWTMERLLALDHESTVALWKTLPAAGMAELDGHYQGVIPNAGDHERQTRTSDFMYAEDSVRGYWLGKAYRPLAETEGEGYNRWRFPDGEIVRNGRFATRMGPSLIDGQPSYIMDYSAFSDTTLVDEIRKLDEGVYLGVGTTETEDGGRSAPGHFALVGPTDEWVGAEE